MLIKIIIFFIVLCNLSQLCKIQSIFITTVLADNRYEMIYGRLHDKLKFKKFFKLKPKFKSRWGIESMCYNRNILKGHLSN